MIDYAKIIETANVRKEALQELETLLTRAEEMADMLQEIHDWTAEVRRLYHKRLDTEGRDLLPKALQTQLAGLPHTYIERAVDNDNGIGLQHLAKFIASLK